MVANERKKMDAPACNSRNEWSSNPLTSPRCGRLDGIDWSNRVPVIVPCYNGRKLQIHAELVVNGLSAISIRHDKGNCGEIATGERCKDDNESRSGKDGVDLNKRSTTDLPVCLDERMKRRNSFWNMHRPELSKLTWPQNFVTPIMLRDFFHHHFRTHGTFCEPLHTSNQNPYSDEGTIAFRELVPPTAIPPDEKAINIMEKSRSVQLNDEDLDPEIMVHKSRAEFCVIVGEYGKKSTLKRSTSHQLRKTNQSEVVPAQRDGDSKEEMVGSEEIFSSIIDSTGGQTEVKTNKFKNEDKGVSNEVTEDSGDPSGMRTILSPRAP